MRLARALDSSWEDPGSAPLACGTQLNVTPSPGTGGVPASRVQLAEGAFPFASSLPLCFWPRSFAPVGPESPETIHPAAS